MAPNQQMEVLKMSEARKLTDEQRSAIDDVGDELDKALASAREKLSHIGIDDDDGSTHCLVCSCPSFVAPAHPVPNKCERTGCGHFFTRHYVF
jgi:hypothetical protein